MRNDRARFEAGTDLRDLRTIVRPRAPDSPPIPRSAVCSHPGSCVGWRLWDRGGGSSRIRGLRRIHCANMEALGGKGKPEAFFQNIHAGLNYQNIEESRHTRRFNSSNLTNRKENVNVLGANLDFQKVLSKHIIRFGLDAQYNSLKSTAFARDISVSSESPLDTRYPDGDNTMTNAALYFSHTWKINDEVTLTDGIRVGFISLHSTSLLPS